MLAESSAYIRGRKFIAGLILAPMKAVGAEGKLLLLRFALVYGDAPVKVTTRVLARKLGIPLNAISKAASELDAAGLMLRRPVLNGRGRPLTEYRLAGERLADLVAENQGPADHHRLWPVMEKVLREPMILAGEGLPAGAQNRATLAAVAPSRRGAGSKLSDPNRMLLLVMLALADDCGVVRGRGLGYLALRTGISRSRVQLQVAKLLALGYVRAAVPGVTGSLLFGKVAGTYFMNLQHPAYGEHARPAGIYLFSCPAHIRDSEIRCLIKATGVLPLQVRVGVRMLPNSQCEHPLDPYGTGGIKILAPLGELLTQRGQPTPAPLEKLAPLLLDGLRSRELIDFLQLKLEEYAAWLLSTNWRRLRDQRSWENLHVDPDLAFTARIVRDIVPASFYRRPCTDLGVPGSIGTSSEATTKSPDSCWEGCGLGPNGKSCEAAGKNLRSCPRLAMIEKYRLLVGFLYQLAVNLADVIKQALMRTNISPRIKQEFRFEEQSYVLLPAPVESGELSFAVMLYPKAESSLSPPNFCVCPEYRRSTYPLRFVRPQLSESDYSLDERYRYGLLQKPKAPKGGVNDCNLYRD